MVEFLRESAAHVPELGESKLAERMQSIGTRWCNLAALLKQQSERETCDPGLFALAGKITEQLANAEESFFVDALALTERLTGAATR